MTSPIEPTHPPDQGTIRRPAPRFDAAAVATGTEVTLEPIGRVTLVNVSETGALLEAATRPAVGTPVWLRLDPEPTTGIPGRVVRTRVSALHADEAMRYQLGVAFDERIVLPLKVDVAHRPNTIAAAPELSTRPALEWREPVNEW